MAKSRTRRRPDDLRAQILATAEAMFRGPLRALGSLVNAGRRPHSGPAAAAGASDTP